MNWIENPDSSLFLTKASRLRRPMPAVINERKSLGEIEKMVHTMNWDEQSSVTET